MLYKGDPDLCYDCHQQKRAQAQFPSHHPIREGKMQCKDCHNTHGSDQNGLRAQSVNDLCYDCHQQLQAQMQFPSHHPVREGKMKCSDCHTTHGAESEVLTQMNVNALCYECHAEKQGPFLYEHSPVEEDCNLCHDPHTSG